MKSRSRDGLAAKCLLLGRFEFSGKKLNPFELFTDFFTFKTNNLTSEGICFRKSLYQNFTLASPVKNNWYCCSECVLCLVRFAKLNTETAGSWICYSYLEWIFNSAVLLTGSPECTKIKKQKTSGRKASSKWMGSNFFLNCRGLKCKNWPWRRRRSSSRYKNNWGYCSKLKVR